MTSRVTPAAGPLGANRTDAVVAAVLVALGLVQVTLWPIADSVVGQLYVVGTTAPLAWRRTHPVPSAVVSTLPWFVPTEGFPLLGFVAVVLQFFALGSWGRPGRAVVAATLWAAFATAVGTLVGPEAPVAAIGAVIAVAAPVLAGRLVAHLRAQNAELARLAERLREERRRAEEAAVEAERARIAQELHDVVGHEVTLIAVQAEAAAAALRLAPERAAEPVEAIRATAHRTLAEIRGVLDVMSPDVDVRGASDDLTEVARRAEQGGIPNVLEVCGAPAVHQEQARLAVNRIVRECLTNAGRHAPGEPVSIEVTWEDHQVLVHATNRTSVSAAPEAGRGLTGMRHRAELLGGAFHAGPRDGRFDVRVTLPLVAESRP
ncbi:sensor histidine kinase [Nocardioides sp. MAHUQ-72]|uniref:sensor histidine kinase n=1 Tax=unclassified Nocardioides TaxID=2615069 RepID=UPI00361503A2